jgi:hypothetical protein
MKKINLFAFIFFTTLIAFSQKTTKFNLDFVLKLNNLRGNEYINHCKKIGMVIINSYGYCCLPNSEFEQTQNVIQDHLCIADYRSELDRNYIEIEFGVANTTKNISFKKNQYFENIVNELKLRKYKSEKLYSSWFNVYVTKYYISNILFIYTYKNHDVMQFYLTNKDMTKKLYLIH